MVVTEDGTDLVAALRDATAGAGGDLVLDANGGPQVEQLVAACAPGATVLVHGGLSGEPTPLPGGRYTPVWLRRYTVFEITTDPAACAAPSTSAGLATGAFTRRSTGSRLRRHRRRPRLRRLSRPGAGQAGGAGSVRLTPTPFSRENYHHSCACRR